MINVVLRNNTDIVYGKGSVSRVGELIREQGGTKVLIHHVSEPFVQPLIDEVKGVLEAAGLAYVDLGGVVPNPRLSKVYEGIELCRKEGVDPAGVYGYDREEFTHTAVAAQIAGGTADAGMGILSAAKIYGLDFLPVCVEQYDLIIPDYAWDTPMVRQVLEILAGPAFRARLEKLGGYTLDQPGRVRRVY